MTFRADVLTRTGVHTPSTRSMTGAASRVPLIGALNRPVPRDRNGTFEPPRVPDSVLEDDRELGNTHAWGTSLRSRTGSSRPNDRSVSARAPRRRGSLRSRRGGRYRAFSRPDSAHDRATQPLKWSAHDLREDLCLLRRSTHHFITSSCFYQSFNIQRMRP